MIPFASYNIVSVIFAIVLFVAWIIATYLASLSGWAQLSKKHKYYSSFTGTPFKYVSCKVGSVLYWKSCNVKYNQKGLYIKLPYIFKFFHPPLYLPWNEFKLVRQDHRLNATAVHLKIENTVVQIPTKLYDSMSKTINV